MSRALQSGQRKVEAVRHTVLLVGEGYSEIAFLKHFKSLRVTRNCGVCVRLVNAYGKGAKNVVDVAIRHSLNAQYDIIGALFDADTDWSTKLNDRARQNRVHALPMTPCIEGMLLRVGGLNCGGMETSDLKRQFGVTFELPAHCEDVYPRHFPLNRLEAARGGEIVINELFTLLSAPTIS